MANIPVDVTLNIKKIIGLSKLKIPTGATPPTKVSDKILKDINKINNKMLTVAEKNRKLSQDFILIFARPMIKQMGISARLFRKFLSKTGLDKVSEIFPKQKIDPTQAAETFGKQTQNMPPIPTDVASKTGGAEAAGGKIAVAAVIIAGALIVIQIFLQIIVAVLDKMWRNMVISQKLFDAIKKLLKLILLPIDAVVGGVLLYFLRLLMPFIKMFMMVFRPIISGALQKGKSMDLSNTTMAMASMAKLAFEVVNAIMSILLMGIMVEFQKGINNAIAFLAQTFVISMGNLLLPLIESFLGVEAAEKVANALAKVVGSIEYWRLTTNKDLDEMFEFWVTAVANGITDIETEATDMSEVLKNMATTIGNFNLKVEAEVIKAENLAEKYVSPWTKIREDFEAEIKRVEELKEQMKKSMENAPKDGPLLDPDVGKWKSPPPIPTDLVVLEPFEKVNEKVVETSEKVGFLEGIIGWLGETLGINGQTIDTTFRLVEATFIALITPLTEVIKLTLGLIIIMGMQASSMITAQKAGTTFIQGIQSYIGAITLANQRVIRLISDLNSAIASAKAAAKEANESGGSGRGYDDKGNDMIITKTGKVIKTHPDDNIIATKGGVGGNTNINISVNGFVGSESQLAREIEKVMYKSLRRQTGMGGGA